MPRKSAWKRPEAVSYEWNGMNRFVTGRWRDRYKADITWEGGARMPRSWILVVVMFVVPGVMVLAGAEGKKEKPKTTVNELAWLSGSWSYSPGWGVSEVHWSRPLGGTMMGMSRWVSSQGGSTKTESIEFLKLEDTPTGVVFTSWFDGKPAVRYSMTEHSGESAVFENPNVEGPNVIRYWKVDESTLHERLESKNGVPPSNMNYTRVMADGRPPESVDGDGLHPRRDNGFGFLREAVSP